MVQYLVKMVLYLVKMEQDCAKILFLLSLPHKTQYCYATMEGKRATSRKRLPAPAQVDAKLQAKQHCCLQDTEQQAATRRFEAPQCHLRGSLLHPQRPLCVAAQSRGPIPAHAPTTSLAQPHDNQH